MNRLHVHKPESLSAVLLKKKKKKTIISCTALYITTNKIVQNFKKIYINSQNCIFNIVDAKKTTKTNKQAKHRMK